MIRYEDKFFIFDEPQQSSLRHFIRKCHIEMRCALYKMYMNIHHPAKVSNKKYRVALCAIFKNEAPYLREWIEFHKIIGIDHFYMYNNNSDDQFQAILQKYIDQGDVTLVDWPRNQAQMEAYEHCISHFKSETRWLGFIDLDEFIVPKSTNDIYSFLSPFEKNRGAVMIYWKLFGSSGHYTRNIARPVTLDFTVCWPKYCNIGKCFYNTNYDFDATFASNQCFHHSLWARFNGKNLPPVNIFDRVVYGDRHKASTLAFPIQINHYFTKSYEEYAIKRAKGDVYFEINPHDEAYFYEHEMKCTDTDHNICKFLIKLQNAMTKGVV